MNDNQINGILRSAASRRWEGVSPDTTIADIGRADVATFAEYRAKDGGIYAVDLRLAEVHFGDDVLPIRAGYFAADDVLLVEDWEANKELMKFMFEDMGRKR